MQTLQLSQQQIKKFSILFLLLFFILFSITNLHAGGMGGGGMGGGGSGGGGTTTYTQGSLRDFAIRNPVNTRNIKGNMQVIGNTVLCVKDTYGNCYDYTGTKSNAELNLGYIDNDSIYYSSYNNSSQAKISIPDNATVKWAAIYTQGYLNGETYSDSETILADPIYITAPSISRFSVTPDVTDLYANTYNNYLKGYTYSTYAELPELVDKLGSEINGWVTVACVKAYTGTDLTSDGGSGLGNFGAWTLVIVYEDSSESLKNISIFDGYKMIAAKTGFDSVDITVDGFLTPTYGDISSTLSIFTGEGDKNIDGDKLYVDGSPINETNAFYSSTSGFDKDPDYGNNQGIDIQNHDIGAGGFNIIQNAQTESTITLTSSQDTYFPNMVAFTTDLYEPRVCYKQEFLDANGDPITTLTVGDTITVHTWIANMKKDVLDLNLEDALKVEITMELDTDNLDYTPNTMYMKNIGATVYTSKTDASNDDIGEYSSLNDAFTWRVGTGANATDGGTLTPNADGNASNKAYITFQTTLKQSGDININNLYKVSYEDSLSGTRFGDESPIEIGLCTDINTSLGVAGTLGKFNVVNENFTSATDYNDPAQNALYTQVANRPFNVKVISLEDDGSALKSYSGSMNISLITTPNYAGCNDDTACMQTLCDNAVPINTATPLTFSGTTSTDLSNYTVTSASKSVSFRISYDSDTKFSCSVDSFAVRPDVFALSAPAGEDINLLRAAQNYNFSLNALPASSSSTTQGYNITSANNVLTLTQSIYPSASATTPDNTLNGTLAFSGFSFDITNGTSSNVGINFNDVGKVNIHLEDRTWAQIDIDNGDTTADCSNTGAYICGDINATFIPDNFNFTTASLNNENGGAFTYLSNNTNMSARMAVTLQARNANNVVTQNFDGATWENPVDITMVVTPTITTPPVTTNDANDTINLGFTSGTVTIPWNETNVAKQLSFNFQRSVNTALNPFVINGADVNLSASSTYTSGTNTATVQGNSLANQSATFIYERVHAPRYRFSGSSGTAFIYYETYCNGTDTNGNTCNTALLPDGTASQINDDPRWYINTQHIAALGTVNSVTQRNGAGTVTQTASAQTTPYSSTLTYDGSAGYPYKTTMQITPSNWLVYNRYNAAAVANEFEVEFENSAGIWNGANEAQSNTNDSGATKTNRRSMW